MKKIENTHLARDLIILFLEKLSTEKNLSQSTISSYNTDLKSFNKHIKKSNFHVLKCSYKNISDWIIFLNSKGIESSTLARKISVLKQFFSFLYTEKYINKNPASSISISKNNKRLPKFLDEKDISKIFTYLYENKDSFKNLQALLLTELLYATGLRVTELVSMKISDLSENLDSIQIVGKGNKERVIPIPNLTKKVLKKYIESVGFIKLAEKAKDNWLFPSHKQHLTRQAYYYKLKIIAHKAGLNFKKISPHMLRHAFASHMLKNGADLKVIQYLLGHEDISTVQIYTHINLRDSLEAIKKHPIHNNLGDD